MAPCWPAQAMTIQSGFGIHKMGIAEPFYADIRMLCGKSRFARRINGWLAAEKTSSFACGIVRVGNVLKHYMVQPSEYEGCAFIRIWMFCSQGAAMISGFACGT